MFYVYVYVYIYYNVHSMYIYTYTHIVLLGTHKGRVGRAGDGTGRASSLLLLTNWVTNKKGRRLG